MKVVIDTNSLLSLVRYYLPFDKKGILFQFFKKKIKIGEIIIIDKVLQECTYNSKGIVLTTLNYLNDADMKQIILCLNLLKDEEKVVLVTEETESSNDNKLFKKIPAICKELNIETLTLPELLAKYDVIDIDLQ